VPAKGAVQLEKQGAGECCCEAEPDPAQQRQGAQARHDLQQPFHPDATGSKVHQQNEWQEQRRRLGLGGQGQADSVIGVPPRHLSGQPLIGRKLAEGLPLETHIGINPWIAPMMLSGVPDRSDQRQRIGIVGAGQGRQLHQRGNEQEQQSREKNP
jgi:hypothetical protein